MLLPSGLLRRCPRSLQHVAARTRRRLRRAFATPLIRAEDFGSQALRHASRTRRGAQPWTVTILGLLGSLLLQAYGRLSAVAHTDAQVVFLGVAALLGTMIALVVTLAVIPLQRAVEISTAMAVRSYRDDRVAGRVFIFLSLMALASLAFAILPLPATTQKMLLVLQVAELAFGIDLLRLHFRRVARLLDISTAVTDAAQETERLLRRVRRWVARRARLMRAAHVGGARFHTASYEAVIYASNKPFHALVVDRVNQLGETARKAMARGEIAGSIASVRAIEGICAGYLRARQSNGVLVPTGEGVFDSDLRIVLAPSLEQYSQTAASAVATRAEPVMIEIVESLGRVALQVTGLRFRGAHSHTAPIAYQPLWRLTDCVKRAQRAGFDDAVLSGVRVLVSLCSTAPNNLSIDSLHYPVAGALADLGSLQVVSQSPLMASTSVNALLQILAAAIDARYYQLEFLAARVLDSVETIVSLSISMPQSVTPFDLSNPARPAYDPSKPFSLPNLVRRSLVLVRPDPHRAWLSPYREFLDLGQKFSEHLRSLAKHPQLGEGFVLLLLLLGQKAIFQLHVGLLEAPGLPDQDRDALLDQTTRYASFSWAAFRASNAFSFQAAEQASDDLAWLGMKLWNYIKVRDHVLSSIESIIASACEKRVVASPYKLSDLLMKIEYLRMFAESKGQTEIASAAMLRMQKPAACSEEFWIATEEALSTRRSQLGESFADPLDGMHFERAKDVLRRELLLPPDEEA